MSTSLFTELSREAGLRVNVGSESSLGVKRLGMARVGHTRAEDSGAAVCLVSSTKPGTEQMLRKHLWNLFEDEIF